MRHNLAERQDLRSRTLALGASTADYCSRLRRLQSRRQVEDDPELVEQWRSLDIQFDALEADLHLALPYCTSSVDVQTYPQWYRPISSKPGGPLTTHSYRSEDDAAIWNAERMARMRLQSLALISEISHGIPAATRSDDDGMEPDSKHALSTDVQGLVEDLCASIFYCLSSKPHGSKATASFEDIAGGKAYALISPLAVASECLQTLPASDTVAETLEWITDVTAAMRHKLGISEAWCWESTNEDEARDNIERELNFKELN